MKCHSVVNVAWTSLCNMGLTPKNQLIGVSTQSGVVSLYLVDLKSVSVCGWEVVCVCVVCVFVVCVFVCAFVVFVCVVCVLVVCVFFVCAFVVCAFVMVLLQCSVAL